ncbi:hypothetical protein STEG23_021066 [Scotinomys teguina]
MARKVGQGKEEEESRARQQEEKTPACHGRGHHVVEQVGLNTFCIMLQLQIYGGQRGECGSMNREVARMDAEDSVEKRSKATMWFMLDVLNSQGYAACLLFENHKCLGFTTTSKAYTLDHSTTSASQKSKIL